jgi:hypothetical protein
VAAAAYYSKTAGLFMNGGGGAVSGELVARDVVCQKKIWAQVDLRGRFIFTNSQRTLLNCLEYEGE